MEDRMAKCLASSASCCLKLVGTVSGLWWKRAVSYKQFVANQLVNKWTEAAETPRVHSTAQLAESKWVSAHAPAALLSHGDGHSRDLVRTHSLFIHLTGS